MTGFVIPDTCTDAIGCTEAHHLDSCPAWQETAPDGFVTEYAITLGIYDDNDVVPTVVFGVVLPYNGCDLNALVSEMCQSLLLAARKEYGSKIHRHAAFWSGSERQVPVEQSLAVTQGAQPE